LAALDRLLSRKKNQRVMVAALEEDLRADPVRFFKTVVMPLLPREARLSIDNDGVILWKSLLGDEPGEKPRFDDDGNPLPDADAE